MEKYDTYKDSNVLWIGEIPDTWNIVKFNHFVFLKHGYQFRDYDFTQTGLKIIKITQLKSNGELETEKVSYIDEKRLENFENILINEGDILMALTGGTIGKIIKVKKVVEPLLQNYRVGNFFPSNEKLDKSFLFWILSSNYILAQIFFDQRETGQPNIGKENFGRMFLTLPKTIKEQTKIANYLDQKTTEIDQLINQKETLLKHYAEEKTAIINQAVTKGINPNIKLKDSGVDWLSEIPEHWEVKKLKYLGVDKLKYGANESAIFENRGDPRYIRITDFGKDGKLKKNTFKSLPTSIAKDFLLEDGDILFARSGATVGKTFQFKNYDGLACYAGYLIKVTPNESIILSDLLYLFTKSSFYNMWKESIFNKATIQNIGADKYVLLDIPIPPKKEQTQIVKHIETETAKINTKETKTKKLIKLLKEYKTALISEVVTGKIKVN